MGHNKFSFSFFWQNFTTKKWPSTTTKDVFGKNPQIHHISSKKQMLSLPYLDYRSLQVTIHTKVSKENYLSTYL
jgi:hypothetical protein